jgi:hypothetical protein
MRTIGIRHRVKATAKGEARPTQVAILVDGEQRPTLLDLADETCELDFMLGRYPVAWQDATSACQLEGIRPHHLRLRAVRKADDISALLTQEDGGKKKVVQIPTVFEGLQADDRVAMILGGSGDNFAFALSKRGEEISASVHRVPPFILEARRDGDKEDDARNLITLFLQDPTAFFKTEVRDRGIIMVRGTYFARDEAMKARLAAEARLRARYIGKIFRSTEGGYPEGILS